MLQNAALLKYSEIFSFQKNSLQVIQEFPSAISFLADKTHSQKMMME